jgi:hypothetical protein
MQYNAQYNYTNVYTLFENSALCNTMQTWYANNVGTDIKAIARDYEYQTANGSYISKGQTGAGIEYDWTGQFTGWSKTWNLQRGYTKPSGTIGEGKTFILSLSEFNGYLNGTTKKSNGYYWLRTPGNTDCYTLTDIHPNGAYSTWRADDKKYEGFRAAVWVSVN